MKILIAGGGKIGSTLTRQLSEENHEIIMIDKKLDVLERLMDQYDVIGVSGNAAAMDVLEQAGVYDADLLIAVSDKDEINLLSCVTAHLMNPNLHTIARIRGVEYRRQAYELRSVFGLNMAINPELQGALAISRLLKYPGSLKVDSFAKGAAELVELKVAEGSPLENVSLSRLSSIVHCKVLVCGVYRKGKYYTPDGNFVLLSQDKIFVAAKRRDLFVLLQNLHIVTRKVKRVLITGGGHISYYLAQELLKAHMEVEIIERDIKLCEELADRLPECTIVEGDASNQSFLDQERLTHFDAMVNLTGIDEMNIIMSIYGMSKHLPLVVTKLTHSENTDFLDQLPIGSVISPKELCAELIVRYVRAMQNQKGAALSVHLIANGLAEASEFLIDEDTLHCNEKLKQIKLKKNVLITSIVRNGIMLLPDGESVFKQGDTMVVITDKNTPIMKVNDIFEDDMQ